MNKREFFNSVAGNLTGKRVKILRKKDKYGHVNSLVIFKPFNHTNFSNNKVEIVFYKNLVTINEYDKKGIQQTHKVTNWKKHFIDNMVPITVENALKLVK